MCAKFRFFFRDTALAKRQTDSICFVLKMAFGKVSRDRLEWKLKHIDRLKGKLELMKDLLNERSRSKVIRRKHYKWKQTTRRVP